MKKRPVISLILSLLVVFGVGSSVLAQDSADALFTRVRNVYNVVNSWHKDGADIEKFTAGAIKGGLEALGDPYTAYFTPKEYSSFIESLNGNFSGIGAYLEQVGNYVVIASPIKGSPAANAGLEGGDRILEVNGESLVGATTDKAVHLIRGPENTTVTLKIERPSANRTFTVTITRARISIPEVEFRMLEGQIGYIQLSTFGDDAVEDFYTAVDKLKQQGAIGLVLDIRQNGGGYLNAAIDIASAFVPKGEPIVWEVSRDGKTSQKSSGRSIGLPSVVLVDNSSASASEVLAGAIQDHKVAPLVGVKTFGKGTVQQILTLGDGSGMKVTIAEYLTPKERKVHGVGLTPDFIVKNPLPAEERTKELAFERILLPSTAGLDVLYVQYRLVDLGYRPENSGFFGMNTTDAVLQFRADYGLPADPLVDELFTKVLNEAVKAHTKALVQEDAQLKKALDVLKQNLK